MPILRRRAVVRCRPDVRSLDRPPRKRFPRNETPKEPVSSRYRYPDASNKYIIGNLYIRQTVNNRDEVLGCEQQLKLIGLWEPKLQACGSATINRVLCFLSARPLVPGFVAAIPFQSREAGYGRRLLYQ